MLPSYIGLNFTFGDIAEFRSDQETGRQWNIDLITGKVVSGKLVPLPEVEKPPAHSEISGVPVPEYLREALKPFVHFGRGGLAAAFLTQQGILKRQPQYPDAITAASPDGRHILYMPHKGELHGELIYGDTTEKRVVRWKRPESLKHVTGDFFWVVTP